MFASSLYRIPANLLKRSLAPPTTFINHMHNDANIKVGDFIKDTRSFSQKEVNEFALLSGDMNPVHVDPEFAKKFGVFDGTIVHGAFVSAFISGILGTKFPGPGSIAVSFDMRFPKPLYIGETVEATVTVSDIKKQFIFCKILCTVGDKTVYDGNATVWKKTN